ncbi:MAG: hypothetical protein P8Y76_11270, partial [bacterium]
MTLLLVVALGAVVAWSRTEHALTTVVQALERASDGRLELHGVAGTLYGPLTVQRLVLREAGSEVVVEALALEWSPAALLAATLRVDRLVAKSVSVKTTADGSAAASPPVTLRVPLRVALPDVRIEHMAVQGQTPFEVAPLAGALTLGLTRHTLALRELGTPWARISGELSVGAWAPFQLEGRAQLRALNAVPLDAAEARISGRLARINLQLVPMARWLAGDVAAVVAPFKASPLQGLSAALKEVDLAGLNPLLPATRVSLDARLFADGAQLAGPVSLANALAGPLDGGRIPLSAARGKARFDGARLRLDDLMLSFGEAGNATGRLELGLQGYSAALDTDGLRLDRLHGALRPLRPAGSLRLTGTEDGEQLEARLTEGDATLALSARRSGERITVESASLRMPDGELAASGELLLNEAREFKLDARLQNFDPGRFVAMPPAQLNGTLKAGGALQPEWRAEIAYRIADSRFAAAPLSGEGKLTMTRLHIAVQTASLTLGANRRRAAGRFGRTGDRLNIDVDAPRFAQLGLGAGGALRAKGWIGGEWTNPAFALEGEARGLRVAGRSLARLEASFEGRRGQHVLRA